MNIRTNTGFTSLATAVLSLVAMGALRSPAAVPTMEGLVAHYPFNGNANDESGNGNHGANAGAMLTSDRFGQANSAYSFDGNGFISLDTNRPIITGLQTNFSISVWFRADTLAGGDLYAHRAAFRDVALNWSRGANPQPGSVGWEMFDAMGNIHSLFSDALPTNEWIHCVGTYNGATQALYINGTLSKTALWSVPVDWSTGFIAEGMGGLSDNAPTKTYFFNGDIDDVRVYTRALTPVEVADLHAAESLPPVPACVTPPGLVGWWKAENSTADTIGNNHGSGMGGVGFAPGKVGQGFLLDGTDDWVRVPDANSLDLTNEITIEFWFKSDAWLAGTSHAMVDKRTTGDCNYGVIASEQWGLQLYYNDPSVQGGDHPGNEFEISAHFPLPAVGVFHHFAGTYQQVDAQHVQLKTYVNGALVEQRTFNGSLANTVNGMDLAIGASRGGAGEFFKGVLDEVSLYNRALGSNEIAAIHAAGSAGKCLPPVCDLPEGTVSWWKGEGDTMDSIGNNNATAVGGVRYVPGKVGTAFQFDGVGGYLSVPNSPSLNFSNELSLEFWFKNEGLPAGGGLIAKRGTTLLPCNFGVNILNSGVGAYFNDPTVFNGGDDVGAYEACRASQIPVTNQFNHLAATWRQSSSNTIDMQVFLNGQLVRSRSVAGNLLRTLNSEIVTIGASAATGEYFTGIMDEVTLYNRVLGSNEVVAIYYADSSGKCPPQPPVVCDLPEGIVSWWKAENDVLDAIGTNHGELVGEAGFDEGIVGQAFRVNGEAGRLVRIPDAPTLNVTNHLTFEAWVNVAAHSVYDAVLVTGKDAPAGVRQYMIGLVNVSGKWVFRAHLGLTSGFQVMDGTTAITTGNWYHVAMCYDGAQLRLYVNGTQDASMPASGAIVTSASPLLIGGFGTGPWNFNGRVDEVSLYKRALASNEIAAIHAAGSAGKCPPQPPACDLPEGIVSWWRAEQNGLDSVATNHGSLNGAVGFAPGRVGQAFTFDGSNSSVDMGDWFAYQTFSLSLWVNPGASQVEYANILDNFHNENQNWVLQQNSTALNQYYFAVPRGVAATTYSTFTLAPNQWQHVVITRDTSNHNRVYVNGALVAEAQDSGPVNYTGQSFRVGGHASNTRYWNGQLDELAVFNRALTVNEIGAIYAKGIDGSCPPPTCNVPDGIVSWWKAEQNGLDSVATNHGLLAGNATFDAGKVGQSFKFDGNGDAVQLGNPASLQLQNFTIETWMKRASSSVVTLDPAQTTTAFIGYGFGGYGFGMFDDGSLFLTRIGIDAAIIPSAITDTNWHHVAVAKNGSNVVFYVDGQAQPALAPYTSTFNFSTSIAIGARGDNLGNGFLGQLDEMTVYDRPLAGNEIAAIHAAGSSGKCPPPPACQLPSGIAAWWKLENNGLDSVGTNVGALFGEPAFAGGKVGQAMVFDGGNDHVKASPSPSLDVGAGAGMTIEAWIQPVSVASQQPIVEWNNNVGAIGAHFWISVVSQFGGGPGSLWMNLMDTSGEAHQLTTAPGLVVTGSYQHVAMTYDKASGAAALYLNGSPVAQGNLGSFTPDTRADAYLGYRSSGAAAGTRFQGGMDEVSIYGRALSATEIAAIHAAGSGGKCPPVGVPPTITQQPADIVLREGKTATFGVQASGSVPLQYQWTKDGQALGGATNSTLMLANVQSSDAAPYAVVVANPFGSVTSRVASLTVNPPPVCTTVPEGVVAWWPGESNLLDVVNGFDGISPRMSYSTGYVGRAFVIGINRFSAPVEPELNLGIGPGFTFEGWINPTSVTGTHNICGWGPTANSSAGVNLRIVNPGILEAQLVRTDGRTTILRTAAGALQLGQWQHLALSCDTSNGLMSILHNGVFVAQTNIGRTTLRTSGAFQVGVVSTGGFPGLLDEPTLYGRALSQPEIAAIYLADEAGKCPLPPLPPLSCLEPALDMVAWWRGESNTVDSVFTNNLKIMPTNKPLSSSYTAGKVGNAFWQRGNDHLEAPAAPALDLGAGQGMTVEAWVYPDQYRAQPFVEWNSGTGVRGVGLGYAVTAPVLEADLVDVAGVSHIIRSPSGLIGSGSWQHLAVAYNRSNGVAMLYFNGSAVATTNLGVFTPRTTGNLYLGYRPPGSYPLSGSRFIGRMDEVALYGRALTDEEVRAAYRARAGRCTEAPLIVEQPASQVVVPGELVQFNPTVTGNPLLRYQWFKDGLALAGASSRQLTLPAVGASDEGVYQLVVSNNFGFATSSNAVLVINQPPLADAGATELLLISPNGSDAVAVLDGSRSSDPDGDALAYEWFRVGESNAFATGVVAIVNLPLGSHPLALVVDDGWATDADDLTVEVITTAQAIDRLTALAEEGDRPQPLIASLRAALASIDRSQPEVAINQLEAFKNKVLAQVMPVDPELAAQLLADAQAIIDALNGGPVVEVVAVQITSISKGGNGKPKLTLRGNNQRTHVVEVSSNLVDWTPVGVAGKCGDCAFEFEDGVSADTGARYYRVVSPK